jgi:hypothetical protein
MSDIQIYYYVPINLRRGLSRSNIELNLVLNEGNKTYEEINRELRSNPKFCRDEFGIDFTNFVGLLSGNISLYAIVNDKIAGLLSFTFIDFDAKKYILLDGICSPSQYSGMGVGKELLNTLIRIGKNLTLIISIWIVKVIV